MYTCIETNKMNNREKIIEFVNFNGSCIYVETTLTKTNLQIKILENREIFQNNLEIPLVLKCQLEVKPDNNNFSLTKIQEVILIQDSIPIRTDVKSFKNHPLS